MIQHLLRLGSALVVLFQSGNSLAIAVASAVNELACSVIFVRRISVPHSVKLAVIFAFT